MRLRAIDLDSLPQGEWLPKCRICHFSDIVVVVFEDGTFGAIGLDKGYYGDMSLGVMTAREATAWIDESLYEAEKFGLIDHNEAEKIRASREAERKKALELREKEEYERLKVKFES